MKLNSEVKTRTAKVRCQVCGTFEQGKIVSCSRSREFRNPLLICEKCAEDILLAVKQHLGTLDEAIEEIPQFAQSAEDKPAEKGTYICEKCGKEYKTCAGLENHRCAGDK